MRKHRSGEEAVNVSEDQKNIIVGDKLLADRSGVDMKPEQSNKHGKLDEKKYHLQYQPFKEQTGEEQRNGLMTVRSQTEKDSTFNTYLPLTNLPDPQRLSAGRSNEVSCYKQPDTEIERQQNGVSQAGEDAPSEIQSEGEIILLAEDNPAVRSLVMEILRMQGYIVMEATDGEEAIRVFRENQDKIDLVILDAVMPRKNGMEACETIKKAHAGTRVLLMSGYDEDVVFNKGVEDKTVEFISKPLLPEELLIKIREMLNKP